MYSCMEVSIIHYRNPYEKAIQFALVARVKLWQTTELWTVKLATKYHLLEPQVLSLPILYHFVQR